MIIKSLNDLIIPFNTSLIYDMSFSPTQMYLLFLFLFVFFLSPLITVKGERLGLNFLLELFQREYNPPVMRFLFNKSNIPATEMLKKFPNSENIP